MNNYDEQEARLLLALRHMSTKTSCVVAHVARMFNVDVQRLRRHVKTPHSKKTRPPTNQQLNPAQLKALELYIHQLDLLGQPPLIAMWRAAAEHIRRSTTPPKELARMQPLSRDFFKRYLRSNPQVKKVRQKPQEVNKIDA
jgi:hypothetical protein